LAREAFGLWLRSPASRRPGSALMAEIVSLNKLRPGGQSFLTCGCGESTTMAVVVMHDAAGAFISVLVCPECNSEVLVSFGRPQT
jgi:hypothetical protein